MSTCDGFELGKAATGAAVCVTMYYVSTERPRLGEIRVTDVDSSQNSIGSGLVEVVYQVNNNVNNKTWQAICGSSQHDSNNAATACQQLGYNTVTSYTTMYVTCTCNCFITVCIL